MIQRTMSLVLAGVLLVGCRGERVPNGSWGADHVVLTVTDSGGRVEFDCARGTLDHPLRLDDRGRFSVAGTFVPEQGGPVRTGEESQSRPARYQGRLDRQKLEFTVTVEGQTGQGPFTVTLGKAPKLTKCV
ncbi:MAG TPA: hypothetical protein VFS78_04325 [Vicinamibacteria bacterium]|nr:hypothetical protein [Vicinamibacteria bacterium]